MNCLHLFGLCRLGIHHSESCQRWFYRVSLVKSTVFFDSYLNILVFFIFYCFFFFFNLWLLAAVVLGHTYNTDQRFSFLREISLLEKLALCSSICNSLLCHTLCNSYRKRDPTSTLNNLAAYEIPTLWPKESALTLTSSSGTFQPLKSFI